MHIYIYIYTNTKYLICNKHFSLEFKYMYVYISFALLFGLEKSYPQKTGGQSIQNLHTKKCKISTGKKMPIATRNRSKIGKGNVILTSPG